jgi:diadenosine tetraphosphate (Ap4A) HIT family hydrolase
MKLDEAYDDNNIFAKILRGDLPSFKVYEDAHTHGVSWISCRKARVMCW